MLQLLFAFFCVLLSGYVLSFGLYLLVSTIRAIASGTPLNATIVGIIKADEKTFLNRYYYVLKSKSSPARQERLMRNLLPRYWLNRSQVGKTVKIVENPLAHKGVVVFQGTFPFMFSFWWIGAAVALSVIAHDLSRGVIPLALFLAFSVLAAIPMCYIRLQKNSKAPLLENQIVYKEELDSNPAEFNRIVWPRDATKKHYMMVVFAAVVWVGIGFFVINKIYPILKHGEDYSVTVVGKSSEGGQYGRLRSPVIEFSLADGTIVKDIVDFPYSYAFPYKAGQKIDAVCIGRQDVLRSINLERRAINRINHCVILNMNLAVLVLFCFLVGAGAFLRADEKII